MLYIKSGEVLSKTKTSQNYYSMSGFFCPLSNDRHSRENQLLPLSKMDKDAKREGTVAILVGESNFVSLAPLLLNLGVEIIVFADISPLILKTNSFMLKCVKEAENIEDFLKKYLLEWNKNPFCYRKMSEFLLEKGISLDEVLKHENWHEVFRDYEETAKFFEDYSNMLGRREHPEFSGDFDFLDSEERFNKCKQALLKLKFYKKKIDLCDLESMSKWGEELQRMGLKVSFMNLSNIFDYDGELGVTIYHTFHAGRIGKKLFVPSENLFKGVLCLAGAEESIIFYSRLTKKGGYQLLEAGLAEGMPAYKHAMQQYVYEMNGPLAEGVWKKWCQDKEFSNRHPFGSYLTFSQFLVFGSVNKELNKAVTQSLNRESKSVGLPSETTIPIAPSSTPAV